jgi:hypothetical protein
MAQELAYHHDKNGQELEGSIDTLIGGILRGRRVRVVIKDETTEDAYFATDLAVLKVISYPKVVRGMLPLRQAVGNQLDMSGEFALFGSVIETTGKYLWQYGPPLTNTPEPAAAQYEVWWYLD